MRVLLGDPRETGLDAVDARRRQRSCNLYFLLGCEHHPDGLLSVPERRVVEPDRDSRLRLERLCVEVAGPDLVAVERHGLTIALRNTRWVIFEPAVGTLPREQLPELQLAPLRALVARVRERVPLYRERLADVEPDELASLDDLRALPFTRKDDLRDTYPLGMLAVPRESLARIHASSGTTGKPTVVAYTATDLDLFGRVNARSLAMAGVEPGMTLHNAYGYGLFTGGAGPPPRGRETRRHRQPPAGRRTGGQATPNHGPPPPRLALPAHHRR